jgi:hypothetical protein
LRPDLALGVVDRDAPLAALDEHDEGGDRADQEQQQQREGRVHLAGAHLLEGAADGGRQPGDDAGEDQHGDAVADAALGDLLAEPHQEHRACGQCDRRDQHELHAGVDRDALILEGGRGAEALEQRQHQREVARPLGQLAPARLAFLLDRGQRGHDHGHHLDDDGRRDVGHHAHREDGQARQRAAGEHVEQAEDRAFLLLEQARHGGHVDARHGHEGADPVDDQRPEQEEQAMAHLGETRDVTECERRVRGRGRQVRGLR